MNTFPYKYVIGAALLLLALQQSCARAEAIGRADAEAQQVERLTEGLEQLSGDTLRLSERLAALDSERTTQAARDSALIAGLRMRAGTAARELAALRLEDSVNVAGMDAAFDALRARLASDDQPALRVVVAAVNTRISGLQSQISVQTGWLEVSEEQLAIMTRSRDAERVGRRAADALADGLRAQIGQQAEIIVTQAREIDALRDATGGFNLTLDGWWLLPVGVVVGLVLGGTL